jgi:hypothetical protein
MLRKLANNFPRFFAKIFLSQFSTLSRKEVMNQMESSDIKDSEIYGDDFWGHLIWLGKSKAKRNNKLLDFLAKNH